MSEAADWLNIDQLNELGPNTGDWLARFIRQHKSHIDGDEVFILERLALALGGDLQ